jgi:ATP-binding cassette subfamily F protein 3
MAKQKAAHPDGQKTTVTKTTSVAEKKVAPVAAPELKTTPKGPIDKDLQKQIQKLQKAMSQLEKNIETLNKEKMEIENQMADPTIYSDVAKFQAIEKSYHDKNALINSMNKEYEIAFNDLADLESKM